jgi:hypothetical protein
MDEVLGADIQEDLDSMDLLEIHPYVVKMSKITNSQS